MTTDDSPHPSRIAANDARASDRDALAPLAPGAVVACIGLGNMGRPMAGHLQAAGYRLRTWARRAEVMEPLVARGAVACASPADAARTADAVVLNVTSTADVEQVLFGADGVAHGAAPGTVAIDHSTIAAPATRAFAQRLAQQGVWLLDAPVSGGVKGAHAASLTVMVGGDAATLARARPLLACIGKVITHVGASGAGQVAKACNQIIQVVNIEGIAEAMHFARSQGVDPGVVLGAVASGFAGSRMLDLMGPKMVAHDFAAGIEARLHHKDYQLIVQLLADAGLHLPAVQVVARQLEALMAQGWGGQDTSALLKVLEQPAGAG